MIAMDDIAKGRTLAQAQGMTAELGRAIATLAVAEADQGRLAEAREMLEGLVVTNPRDATAWALLSSVLRRQGDLAPRLPRRAARRSRAAPRIAA